MSEFHNNVRTLASFPFWTCHTRWVNFFNPFNPWINLSIDLSFYNDVYYYYYYHLNCRCYLRLNGSERTVCAFKCDKNFANIRINKTPFYYIECVQDVMNYVSIGCINGCIFFWDIIQNQMNRLTAFARWQ